MPSEPLLTPARRHALLVALLWGSILAVLVAFREILTPFLAALLVAYLVAPLVDRLARLKVGGRALPRWGAIVLIYATFFAAVGGFGSAVLPRLYGEVTRMSAEARDFVQGLTPERRAAYATEGEAWLSARGMPVELVVGGGADVVAPSPSGTKLRVDLDAALGEARHGVEVWLQEGLPAALAASRRLVAGTLDGLFVFFFLLMVSAFVLVDVARIHRFVRGTVPRALHGDFDQLLSRLDERLSGVVRGQLVICVVNGVLTLIGLLILDVKFAFVLATIATVLSAIPIFGSVLSTVPIVLVGLSQGFGKGVGALAWIVAIHALEAYFLNPKIMGSAAKIHPAVIAFSLLAGERTFGFTGALLAVPVASLFIGLFEHLAEHADRLDRRREG